MGFEPEPNAGESVEPGATEQSRLFDLLGQINYVVLRGGPMYLQAGGTVYRVLYGVYWQSVFSGEQHWGLRCEEVGRVWAEARGGGASVNLPLRYTNAGWVIEVESLECLLYGDLLSVNGGGLEGSLILRRP